MAGPALSASALVHIPHRGILAAAVPIYEYQCPSCGARFERLTRMGASDRPACPACGAAEAERLISVVARSSGECGPGAFT